MRWPASVCALAFGCAPAVAPGGDGTGTTTTGLPTTATTLDAGDASATSTSASAETSSGLATSAADSAGSDDGTKLDIGMPTVSHCDAPVHAIDLQVITPRGPFTAAHAWWGWEACCVTDPWLILAEDVSLELENGVPSPPFVGVFVRGDPGHRGPYEGELPVGVFGDVGDVTEYATGFVLNEPLDPDQPTDGDLPRFSASFDIADDTWTLKGIVEAPHCAALDTAPCPCE